MNKFLNIFFIFSLLGCSNNSNNEVKYIKIENFQYSHLDGMSGDTFNFNIKTQEDLYTIYIEGKYKYSHLNCGKLDGYYILGSIEPSQIRDKKNKYISKGYIKICKDEYMNTCLDENEIRKNISKDISCSITYGALLSKSKVILDNVVIKKNHLLIQ